MSWAGCDQCERVLTSQYGHAQSGSVHTPPYSGVENYLIRVGGDDGVPRDVRIGEEGGVDHVLRIKVEGEVDHVVRIEVGEVDHLVPGEVDEVQFCFSSVHVKMSKSCFINFKL